MADVTANSETVPTPMATVSAASASAFRPALIVVDVQEDFCPPNGALAVPHGRDIFPAVHALLDMPAFVFRVATQDWHPPNHVSFAANHPGQQPFSGVATIANPHNPHEPPYETGLWPVHCVQGQPGARLADGLDTTRIDVILRKGTHPAVEMYSAFYDPFAAPRVSDSGLAALLRARAATHVFVVGLAADYCVRCTALDAAREGFTTAIVEDATRPVDADAWAALRADVVAASVALVRMDGPEVARLRQAAQ